MSNLNPSIPASWTIAPIAELLAPLDDGRVLHHGWSPQCQKVSAKAEGEWGVLKTTSVQPGAFCPEHNKRLPEKLAPRPHLEVRPGDLLLTCAGPRARCGVPCLVRETRPGLILSGKMYRFRARQGLIEPRYLEAYLLASTTQAAIDRMKTGISDSGLNLTHGRFKKLEVVLAPFREQHRIVEAIESYFTRLDDAVATLTRVQRNLKRYRASVLKAAVEGRLVPTEAELARAEGRDYEPASVLLERILTERRRRWEEAELAKMQAKGKTPKDDKWKAKYKEPVAPDTSELPELPDGWSWVSMDHFLSAIEAGKSFRCMEQPPDPGQIGVVKVSAVTWGTFDEEESKTCTRPELVNPDYFIRSGDFLISRANTIELIGAPVIVGALSKTLMLSDKILRLRTEGGLERWLLWVLRSSHGRKEIERLATGNQDSMRNIGQTNVRRIRVPLPPLPEARRIIETIDVQYSTTEHGESLLKAADTRCGRLRQSILKWAFEGRLVDQDPTDQPASRLLERIRAERESTNSNPRRSPRRPRARSPKA